jgi:ankyrin repeat protein
VVNPNGVPLLCSAAYRGHVGVARELLKHCPDARYSDENGNTCLHQAVLGEQMEFLQFVLGSPQLKKLVNMRDEAGDTALHLAVKKCNPKMVAALLLHQDIDVTVLNNKGVPANWKLPTDHAKTLNWVCMFSLTLVHKSVRMLIFCVVILFSYHPYALLEFNLYSANNADAQVQLTRCHKPQLRSTLKETKD